MKLPLDNPPAGWTVRTVGDMTVLTKSAMADTPATQSSTMVVSAIVIFAFANTFRVLTASVAPAEVLLSPATLGILLLVGVPAAAYVYVRRKLTEAEAVMLQPGRLSLKSVRLSESKHTEVEKNRILRVIHSQPRNPDGTLYGGGSVELDVRTEAGANEEISVMYSSSGDDVLWFVNLLEAWSGMRARVQDFEVDEDESDDEEDDEDALGDNEEPESDGDDGLRRPS